jgi:hypothetical protein
LSSQQLSCHTEQRIKSPALVLVAAAVVVVLVVVAAAAAAAAAAVVTIIILNSMKSHELKGKRQGLRKSGSEGHMFSTEVQNINAGSQTTNLLIQGLCD